MRSPLPRAVPLLPAHAAPKPLGSADLDRDNRRSLSEFQSYDGNIASLVLRQKGGSRTVLRVSSISESATDRVVVRDLVLVYSLY